MQAFQSNVNFILICQVSKLEAELKKCLQHNEQEKKTLVTDYTEQIKSLEQEIVKKQDDIVLMQNELKHVKVNLSEMCWLYVCHLIPSLERMT